MLAAIIVLAICNLGFIGFEVSRYFSIKIEEDLFRENGIICANADTSLHNCQRL